MLRKKFRLGLVAVTLLALFSNVAFAQQEQQGERETRFGIGWQYTLPALGISGMYDVAPDISVQAILGFFGALDAFVGRGIYRFRSEPLWNVYGFGTLGVWSGSYYLGRERITETSLGIGAGAGIEYGWQSLDEDLPPIFWNVEIAIGTLFQEVGFGFQPFTFGVGAHYRF